MLKNTVPPISRPEWRQMVTGEIRHNYKNYVLQARTFQMQKDIASGKMTYQQAVEELFALCSKYALAVHEDFVVIFKNW